MHVLDLYLDTSGSPLKLNPIVSPRMQIMVGFKFIYIYITLVGIGLVHSKCTFVIFLMMYSLSFSETKKLLLLSRDQSTYLKFYSVVVQQKWTNKLAWGSLRKFCCSLFKHVFTYIKHSKIRKIIIKLAWYRSRPTEI